MKKGTYFGCCKQPKNVAETCSFLDHFSKELCVDGLYYLLLRIYNDAMGITHIQS